MVTKLKLASETPGWWNPRGHNMVVGTSGTMLTGPKADFALQSKNSVAVAVRISQVLKRDKYKLEWRVLHSGGFESPHTAGAAELNSLDVRRMFCFESGAEPDSEWMLKQYRGTAAAAGKFLRQDKYLNIPGPGTGRDGDANVSIFVSDEIIAGVHSMLKERRHIS